QGGVTRIHELRFDGHAVWVDRTRAVVPLSPPGAFGAATFEDGSITDFFQLGDLPDHREVFDQFGFASGALAYDVDVSPGGSAETAVAVALHGAADAPPPVDGLPAVGALQKDVASDWSRVLGRVDVLLPAEAKPLVQTLRSTIAYTLVN